MDISIEMPLDGGFLRRECPNCEREFKWFHGETENRPAEAVDPDSYFCPYCGIAAPVGEWLTKPQAGFVEQIVSLEANRLLEEGIKGLKRATRSSPLKITFSHSPSPSAPTPLVEPNDMIAVTFPCHHWESVKIYEEWNEPIHCLICGERFLLV